LEVVPLVLRSVLKTAIPNNFDPPHIQHDSFVVFPLLIKVLKNPQSADADDAIP